MGYTSLVSFTLLPFIYKIPSLSDGFRIHFRNPVFYSKSHGFSSGLTFFILPDIMLRPGTTYLP